MINRNQTFLFYCTILLSASGSHVHHPNLLARGASSPNAVPIPPNKRTPSQTFILITIPNANEYVNDKSLPSPVAPRDCKIENKLPAATIPILDCHEAANDPAATPAVVNPRTGSNTMPKIPVTAVLPNINFLNLRKFASFTIDFPQLLHFSYKFQKFIVYRLK